MSGFNESVIEEAALEYFRAIGYSTLYGPDVTYDGPYPERPSNQSVYLSHRLLDAATRLNPHHPDLVAEAVARLERAESQDELLENARVHRLLVHGVPVEYRGRDGNVRTVHLRLIDFDDPEGNDWVVVNQFSVAGAARFRRPDLVVFVNGIPIAVIELKSATDRDATLTHAWNQIQTYRADIPAMFAPNLVTVLSDGTTATMGSFSAGFEHYAPWKTIDGRDVVSDRPALEVLIRGVFEPSRLLDLLAHFAVFSDEPRGLVKRVAKYHQFWAVSAAVDSTVVAAAPAGDRRGGVVWHTQGSGKSIEMLIYAAKIMRDPRMGNPTLVFITDRNDLDDQLFGEVFAPSSPPLGLLPEPPVQAESRVDLRNLLRRASGGIVFTTLQKFAPELGADANPVLTDRRNVIVVADEAHRSQYGFGETLGPDGVLRAGLAKHMRDALPNATYLGFTGTPIEAADRSTRAVFGDYIDVYDLTRAVEDGATVRIFYESRLAKVGIADADLGALDELADEITEQVEESVADRAKSRWARLEAIVGADDRLDLVAADLVEHWERRRSAMWGKAMIVTMSRRIAVALYDRIVALRPEWHSDDPSEGLIKVVMTGSAADPPAFQPHLHPRDVRRQIKDRAKDPTDPLELVIVRDMWLTGFDAPAMHTMYVDKTMRGAGLMQAIARVNRTYGGKSGGLVVDYIGVFANLQSALAEYSPTDRDQAGVPIEQMVAVMREKHDVVRTILHGCPFESSSTLPAAQRLAEHANVMNFVLDDPDRTARFNDQALALAKAYALCGARDEAVAIRDDVRMFTGVRAAVLKINNPDAGRGGSGPVEIDTAIGQLVNEAVTADEVIDIYQLAGVDTPELSILSDEFLDALAHGERPNLQLGLLRRLLNDEIRTVQRTNVVQARRFSEQLEEAINRYTNRSLTTAEIIAELVKLAKEMRGQARRHEQLGLSVAEAAFYDAIVQNEAAVLSMGDDTLKAIAAELVTSIRQSATVDWNLKESVRAAMRTRVRRLLAKYDYPPDLEERAVELVLEQAELLATDVAA